VWPGSMNRTKDMEATSGFVEIGQARLYYELAGFGQPFVLIHAGVADHRQWNHEFVYFAQEFRVLRYDLRGYGRSLPVQGEFRHLQDLVAVLDQLGIDQPLVLLGCSMGGGLAMNFALAYPDSVKALIMVGSGPPGLRLDVPDHPKEPEAEAAQEAGRLDLVAELEAQIWFDGMGRTAQQVDQSMRKLALEMNRLALTHAAKQLGKRLADADRPAAERLGELKIPVLVIVGEQDLPYLQAAADYMVDHIPFARKVVIQDAAHLANLDHPGTFQDVVRTFLAEIS
jgi:pimeloyl-ACP methyl ester carboxylesterase